MKSLQGAPGCKSSDSFKGGLQLNQKSILSILGIKPKIIKNFVVWEKYPCTVWGPMTQEGSGRQAKYLGNTEYMNIYSNINMHIAIESAVRHARVRKRNESEHNKRMHWKVHVSNTLYPPQEISIYIQQYEQVCPTAQALARADKVYKYFVKLWISFHSGKVRTLWIGTREHSKALSHAILPLSLIAFTMVTEFHTPAITDLALPIRWKKCGDSTNFSEKDALQNQNTTIPASET